MVSNRSGSWDMRLAGGSSESQNHTRHTMAARPQREMLEKAHLHDTFFGLKNAGHPERNSVLTEFMMESDWDEDDILSELEDGDDIVSEGEDCENSPRVSVHSVSCPPSWCKSYNADMP